MFDMWESLCEDIGWHCGCQFMFEGDEAFSYGVVDVVQLDVIVFDS